MIWIIIITLLIVFVLLMCFCLKKEKFHTVSYGDHPVSTFPVFLNLYPDNLSFNPSRFEFLQKLKFLKGIPHNTLKNKLNWPYANINSGFMKGNDNTSPIIIIPGLGCSQINAKWQNVSTRNFYTPDKDDQYVNTQDSFTCKINQYDYTKLWYDCPMTKDKFGKYCWGDLLKVFYQKGQIINAGGVDTYTPNDSLIANTLEPNKYLNNLLETFMSAGYSPGGNLFVANYDFRKIGDPILTSTYFKYLTDLITQLACSNSKVTIITHDLGSTIANLFFQEHTNEWKDKYIKEAIYIAPTIGGTPKALRAYLSGESWFENKEMNRIFRETTRSFSGLLLMLPYPQIYKDRILVTYPAVGGKYDAGDLSNLMIMIKDNNGTETYNNIIKPLITKSLKFPNVNLNIIKGGGQYTESNYNYNNDLESNPQKNPAHNTLNMPFHQQTRFPSYYLGDGTIPDFVINKIINTWKPQTGKYKLNVYSYEMEHTALTKSKPVLELCLDLITK